jgi:hypothetical protein
VAPPGKSGADGAGITFSSFVIGLATQALMFLGAVPDPRGESVEKNPAEAAAIISVIEMLQQKTRGNLSEDEAKLIEEVLYELRLRYVAETRKGGTEAAGHKGGDAADQPTGGNAAEQKEQEEKNS